MVAQTFHHITNISELSQFMLWKASVFGVFEYIPLNECARIISSLNRHPVCPQLAHNAVTKQDE